MAELLAGLARLGAGAGGAAGRLAASRAGPTEKKNIQPSLPHTQRAATNSTTNAMQRTFQFIDDFSHHVLDEKLALVAVQVVLRHDFIQDGNDGRQTLQRSICPVTLHDQFLNICPDDGVEGHFLGRR